MKAFIKSKLVLLLLIIALCVSAITAIAMSPSSKSYASSPCVISLSSVQGTVGTVVTVTGKGWVAGHIIAIQLAPSVTILARATVASDGTFRAAIIIPAGIIVGAHLVIAVDITVYAIAKATFIVL